MGTGEVSDEEEETYTLVSTALKHPIRRRILRMLGEGPLTFTEMQEPLKINSAHLSYHLNAMRELLNQTESGEYFLSTFGEATLSLMHWVEGTEEIRPIIQRRKKMGLGFALLVSMLIVAGIPTATHLIINPVGFPIGAFTVESLTPSDYTVTVENNSFALSLDTAFVNDQGQVQISKREVLCSTKVEIRTKWLKLDPNRIVGESTTHYWSRIDEDGLPTGEYALYLVYRKSYPFNETEIMYGWRSIREDWEPQVVWYPPGGDVRPRIYVFIDGGPPPLPESFLNEYSFRLVVYTNASIGPDEIPARFKLIYKNAMFIGSLRIDPPAIGYGMILLPFALLISRFWRPLKALQRATDKWDDRSRH